MKTRQKTTLRVGIVGCGVIAQIMHLPILSRFEDLEIVALCDVNTSKATIIGERYNIDRVYEDIEDMLQHEPLDVVFILTPTSLHLPMSLLALKHGCHVFIEKPATRNASEAQTLARQAREADRVVMVGMQNRFRSDVDAIKTFLDTQELGKIFFARAGWLQGESKTEKQPWLLKKNIAGGGVLMDLGIQLIDLVWWMNGRPQLKAVKANQFQFNETIEVEDYLSAYLTFENDLTLFCEFSWDYPIPRDRFYVDFYGQKGSSWLSPLRVQRFWHGQILNITPEMRTPPRSIFKKAYEAELQHFYQYLKGQVSELRSPIDDAVQVLRITDTIYQSLEQKKEVQVNEQS